MTAGALRHRGELAAWHASAVIAHIPMTGAALNPAQINPYKNAGRPESAALKRIKAYMTSRALALAAGAKPDDD